MPSQSHITETIDHATGEVLRSERTYTARRKAQLFMSMELPVCPLLHQLTRAKDMRVLLALGEIAEFNTNAVFLVASRRQQVMAIAGVSSAQLSASLGRLRALGLVRGDKGEAVVHPAAFWKGHSAKKRELLASWMKGLPTSTDFTQASES